MDQALSDALGSSRCSRGACRHAHPVWFGLGQDGAHLVLVRMWAGPGRVLLRRDPNLLTQACPTALQPAMLAFGPKIARPGAPRRTYLARPRMITRSRLINVFGIDSPGLTSSLAIAERISRRT